MLRSVLLVRMLRSVLLVRLLALGVALRGLILAILATHICNLREVDIDIATSHYAEVADDSLVIGVLVLELIALVTHKASYVEHLLAHVCTTLSLDNVANKTLGVLTIVFEHHAALGIWQLLGFYLQVLA